MPLQAERLRGLRPEIARRILRGEQGGEIDLAILAYPAPAAGDRSAIHLFVEIDGASFLDANQSRTAQVEIYAYALTATGSVGGYFAEAFTLDVARHGESVWAGGLRFLGQLELPVGEYQLRVMVHNARSLAYGLRFAELSMPAVDDDKPALLAPLFPASRVREAWLAVRGRGGRQAPGGAIYPFAHGGQALLPAALPVLVSRRKSSAVLLADRLPATRLEGRIELLGKPQDPALPDAPPPVVGRAPTSWQPAAGAATAAPISRALSFVTPRVPPGRYELRLVLETASGPIATPALEVLLVEAQPQDRELTWSDLRALEHPLEPSPEPAAPAEPVVRAGAAPPGRGLRRLAGRYRQALAGSLAPGALRPAALIELELSALGRSGEDPLRRLRTAELLVAAELGRRQAGLLLPLIAVHDELFHLYRRRHLFSLVAHTRRLIESLAEVYAELDGRPELAASVLASVGGYMQELRSPGDSRRLFQRALKRDPRNSAALLGLANSYEKYGDYRQAVARLERLVAAQPDLGEARLRLALNLERVGDRLRSRQLLDELAASDEAGWVGAVACEELARSLLEAGAPERAAAVLERAVERMPERQALGVLLAHVYDRQGLLQRSRESLERTAANRRAELSSERLTYDDWENGPLERARRALAEDASRLRPPLAEALAGGGEEASR